jgi:proteasome accessory factor B
MQKVVERILNLLAFLLTSDRPVTADAIRSTVAGYDQASDEAWRRMFERDKELLRQLGIPLEVRPTDAWEVEYGYVVPRDRYLPDPGLTDEERTALWLAATVVRIGGQAPGADALFKLGGAPMAAAGEPLAADLGRDGGDLATAFTAVSDRRRLGFEYRGSRRTIAPYGLVHRRGHWYVVGAEESGEGTIKAYRLDRASKLEAGDTPGAFARPKGFRASDAIPEAPWEAGSDDVKATVRFDPSVAWWARRQLTGRSTVDEAPDGSLSATIPVSNPDAFIGWLVAFEDHAEIVDPPELRDRFVARVRGST